MRSFSSTSKPGDIIDCSCKRNTFTVSPEDVKCYATNGRVSFFCDQCSMECLITDVVIVPSYPKAKDVTPVAPSPPKEDPQQPPKKKMRLDELFLQAPKSYDKRTTYLADFIENLLSDKIRIIRVLMNRMIRNKDDNGHFGVNLNGLGLQKWPGATVLQLVEAIDLACTRLSVPGVCTIELKTTHESTLDNLTENSQFLFDLYVFRKE